MKRSPVLLATVSCMIGCAVALLLAEAALRLVGVSSRLVYAPNPYYGWGHTAGDEYTWTTESHDVEIRINSSALRDRDYPYAKPPSTSRVLVLGDSFAEALQVPLEESFSKLLERRLDDAAPAGEAVEVINAGVSGYGTDNALLFYTHEGYKYEPDVVLLAFYVGNDVRNNWYPLEEQDAGGARKPYFELVDGELALRRYPFAEHASLTTRTKVFLNRHLRLYSFARELRDRWRLAGAGAAQAAESSSAGVAAARVPLDLQLFRAELDADWEEAWKVTRALLRELGAEVRARGGELLVVTIPAAFQVHSEFWEDRLAASPGLGDLDWTLDDPNRRLAELCAEEGIAYADLLPDLRAAAVRAAAPLYFRADNHFNEAGHRVAADVMSRRVAALLAARSGE